jgi:CHAT domain-containing protein
VASLWKVDDRATQVLMADFYENMWKHKMSRAAALQKAQRDMLKTGGGRGIDFLPDQKPDEKKRLPPYYWAAFVLSGDWR